jgi:hypothetical protein
VCRARSASAAGGSLTHRRPGFLGFPLSPKEIGDPLAGALGNGLGGFSCRGEVALFQIVCDPRERFLPDLFGQSLDHRLDEVLLESGSYDGG